MRKTTLIIIAILLLMLTACTQQENTNKNTQEITQETNANTQTNETELPDVVAKINGEEIKQDELLNFQKQMISQNINLNLTETLDQLINRKILVQEAKKRGYEATTKQVEDTLEEQGFSINDTKKLIKSQDMNYEEYLESQLDDILFTQMIEKEMQNITITDEEAKQYFEEQNETSKENTTYEDAEQEIKDALKEQKATEKLSQLISKKLETTNIQVFI